MWWARRTEGGGGGGCQGRPTGREGWRERAGGCHTRRRGAARSGVAVPLRLAAEAACGAGRPAAGARCCVGGGGQGLGEGPRWGVGDGGSDERRLRACEPWGRARGPLRAPPRRRARARAAAAPPAGEGVAERDEAERPKVSMVALGCPKNVVDAEVMLGDLNRAGFDVVEEHESADAVVINSCAFVEEAKDESIQAILEAARLRSGGNPDAKIVVTGCMAQRYGEELAAGLPEADLVVGFENYGQLPTALAGAIGGEEMAAAAAAAPVERVQVGSATVPFREEWGRHRLTPRHTAYLRVAEGCDHACTFCAIPGFRGKFRSKPYARVVDEAQRLAAEGVRELNLIAEDTNQYGMDLPGGHRLAELLAELAEIPGIEWIRLLYCYPSYFSDELIEAIATIPQVCKYVDIPLQHADNLVLLSMASSAAAAHREAPRETSRARAGPRAAHHLHIGLPRRERAGAPQCG